MFSKEVNLKLEVVGPGRSDVLVVFVLSAKTSPLLRLVVVVGVGVVHCLDHGRWMKNFRLLSFLKGHIYLVWFMVMMVVILPSSSKQAWPALGRSTKEQSNNLVTSIGQL